MSVRSVLRSETAHRHERLDSYFSALDIAGPEGYSLFLRAHAAVLVPLETHLEEAGIVDVAADWPQRARRHALLEDLAELGAHPVDAIPVPAFAHPDELFGALYVLEGSRLGNTVLLRQVRGTGSADLQSATRFLSHGTEDRLWGRFLTLLDEKAVDADSLARTVKGAQKTFDTYIDAALLMLPPALIAAAAAPAAESLMS